MAQSEKNILQPRAAGLSVLGIDWISWPRNSHPEKDTPGKMIRRDFMLTGAAAGLTAAAARNAKSEHRAPTMLIPSPVKPAVVSSANGNHFTNGGTVTAVQ